MTLTTLQLVPSHQLCAAEQRIRDMYPFAAHCAEFRDIAVFKWRQARHSGASDSVIELLSEWVARFET
jgi:hypothetical protein